MAHLDHWYALHQAGIVDQDVHRADLFLDLGHHGVHSGLIGHVGHIAVGVHASLFVSGQAFFQAALVGAVEADSRAAGGHAHRDGEADAVGTAGDEGNFAFQIKCRKIHVQVLLSCSQVVFEKSPVPSFPWYRALKGAFSAGRW